MDPWPDGECPGRDRRSGPHIFPSFVTPVGVPLSPRSAGKELTMTGQTSGSVRAGKARWDRPGRSQQAKVIRVRTGPDRPRTSRVRVCVVKPDAMMPDGRPMRPFGLLGLLP